MQSQLKHPLNTNKVARAFKGPNCIQACLDFFSSEILKEYGLNGSTGSKWSSPYKPLGSCAQALDIASTSQWAKNPKLIVLEHSDPPHASGRQDFFGRYDLITIPKYHLSRSPSSTEEYPYWSAQHPASDSNTLHIYGTRRRQPWRTPSPTIPPPRFRKLLDTGSALHQHAD